MSGSRIPFWNWKRGRAAALVMIVYLSAFIFSSHAQPYSLDITFNPGTGTDYDVYSIANSPSNTLVIGGGFTLFNGVSRNRVARLFSDGTLDDSFYVGTGPDTDVYAVSVEPDGRVIIGGGFSSVNFIVRRCLTRLRADGSLDLDFPILDCDSAVRQFQRETDGGIILIGGFTTVGGVTRRNVARLTPAYTVDSSFDPAIGNTNGTINALVVQTNGYVILGGSFKVLNGTNHYYVARVGGDGVVDPSFDAGFIDGTSVTAIALQLDGKVILAGNFGSINGYSRICIARLNLDGTVDTGFVTPGGVSTYLGNVTSISIQADGKILLFGGFGGVGGGAPRNGIARLNTDGTVDTRFANPMPYAQTIYAHLAQSDGKTLIGGNFTRVAGTNINRIARLNGDASPPVGLQFLSANNYFGTFLSGTVSNTYRLEWTTDLLSPSLWTPLFNVILQTNPQFILDTNPISGDQRFYRAVTLP